MKTFKPNHLYRINFNRNSVYYSFGKDMEIKESLLHLNRPIVETAHHGRWFDDSPRLWKMEPKLSYFRYHYFTDSKIISNFVISDYADPKDCEFMKNTAKDLNELLKSTKIKYYSLSWWKQFWM